VRGGGNARKAEPAAGPADEAWVAAGAHTSACERRADEASRDVQAWLKCRFMRDRLGEEFAGTVTAAAPFGVFVTLDTLFVEGLVHVTELGGEYFRYDEIRQELRGERSGMRYGPGTRLQVQVSRVDLDARRIDFRLVRDGLATLGPRRGGGREAGVAGDADLASRRLQEVAAADREAKGVTRRSTRVAGRAALGASSSASAGATTSGKAGRKTPSAGGRSARAGKAGRASRSR
jgi:ribonuclease R